MAKLEIRSIELIAPRSRKSQITEYLQRRGAVEVTVPPETDGLTFAQFASQTAEAEQQLAVIRTGLELLQKYAPRKKPLTAMLEPRKTMTADRFEAEQEAVDDTVAACRQLAALEKEAAELKADNIRLQTAKESLLPWASQDSVRAGHTGRIAYVTGLFRDKRDYEEILTALATLLPDRDCVEAEILRSEEDMTCATFYCLRDDAEEVGEALRTMGFLPAPETPGMTPAEKIAQTDAAIEKNEARIREIEAQLAASEVLYDKAEAAEDLLTMRLDRLAAYEKIPETTRVFRLTGYVAARDADKIKKHIETRYEAAVEISVPGEDEDVPVILSNGFFSAPLENITGMYSLPSKADIDPTPMMAFFYYFFFGMMLSDAGYGLIIALATGGLLLFRKNLEEKMKRTLRMYFFCGLSTVFWGAMYGSWFGDAPAVVAREFFHKPAGFNPAPPIWTDAVADTMNVLIMCFILGLAHLFWGVCMKGLTDIRNGRKLDALLDTVPTFVTVIGIAPVFFGLFVQDSIPENYSALGTVLYNGFMTVHRGLEQIYVWILLAGLIMVILTAGRQSGSVVGKLGGGLYGVYNLFSGYLGDVLSYARLLALGMATGVIGQVMNMLGTLPGNPVIKSISFVLVFIAGHTANLAINIIGAYVHTNRLQYVEFFSKFYEGGGRAFAPLEANTKYYMFKEEQ